MKELDKKRLELDLAKCRAARMELEYKIMEREEEIVRVKEHIELQNKREKEILEKLK